VKVVMGSSRSEVFAAAGSTVVDAEAFRESLKQTLASGLSKTEAEHVER
jgi:hypothetical protein